MGSVLSVYSKFNPLNGWWGKAEVMTPEQDQESEEKKPLSDPSYTLVYQDQEAEILKKFKEEKEMKEKENQRLRDMPSPSSLKKREKDAARKPQKLERRKARRELVLQQRKQEHEEYVVKNNIKVKGRVKEMWCDQSWAENEVLCRLLTNSPKFIHCPNQFCKLPFERIPVGKSKGTPVIVMGEDGRPLGDIHSSHYAENRFRCQQCETVFCAACKATPYHLGKTCEENSQPEKRLCRFCKVLLPDQVPQNPSAPPPVQLDHCKSATCASYSTKACSQKLACGHLCASTNNQKCYCLKRTCCGEGTAEDDFCAICWTEELGAAPCVKFMCEHIFHRHCIFERIRHMWPGSRITFAFLLCPLCSVPMETDYMEVMYAMKSSKDLEKEIKMKALHFLKVEGYENDPQITTPGKKFYNNPTGFAMDLFCFYKCFNCNLPYYGGKRNCEAGQDGLIVFNPGELVCGGCSGSASCDKHGKAHIHYKCRFCCSLASWFCFGLVHYCEKCHLDPYKYWSGNNLLIGVPPQCKGKAECPLGMDHPPNGFEEVVLGCSMCKIEELTGADVETVVENDDDVYW